MTSPALFVALVLCFVGACHGQGFPPPVCSSDHLPQSELTCNPTYQPPKFPGALLYNGTQRMTGPDADNCGPPAGTTGECWECCYREPPATPPRCLAVGEYPCANQGGWGIGVNKIMCWVFDHQVPCTEAQAASQPDKSRVSSYSCCGDPSGAYCLTEADCTGAPPQDRHPPLCPPQDRLRCSAITRGLINSSSNVDTLA